MTATQDNTPRDVLPRWRQWGSARRSGELDPLRSGERERPANALAEQKQAFTDDPGLYTAGDLLSAAAVMRIADSAVHRAAQLVLHTSRRPQVVAELAERAIANWASLPRADEELPQLDLEGIRRRVTRLRQILQREPRNAIRWADLARAHAALGAADSAHRAMTVALEVGPVNRFLLRAAARLDVYRDDADRAISLLNRDQAHLADPWVLAAEIATSNSAERTSKHLRRARKMIEDQNLAPWHVSELASALSAVELRAGRMKQARKLMAISLMKPTENALAQAEWSSSNGLTLPPDEGDRQELLGAPTGYEARARYYTSKGDFGRSTSNAMLWLADQPFALDAAFFASYTAAVLSDDYEAAANASRAGLRTYPYLQPLLNNLAFAYARSNRLAEAGKVLDKMKDKGPVDAESAVATATRGLLAFRLGDHVRGRELYQKAIEALSTFKHSEAAAIASLYWAEEEYISRGSECVEQAISRAADLTKRAPTPAVKLRISYLLDMIREEPRNTYRILSNPSDDGVQPG